MSITSIVFENPDKLPFALNHRVYVAEESFEKAVEKFVVSPQPTAVMAIHSRREKVVKAVSWECRKNVEGLDRQRIRLELLEMKGGSAKSEKYFLDGWQQMNEPVALKEALGNMGHEDFVNLATLAQWLGTSCGWGYMDKALRERKGNKCKPVGRSKTMIENIEEARRSVRVTHEGQTTELIFCPMTGENLFTAQEYYEKEGDIYPRYRTKLSEYPTLLPIDNNALSAEFSKIMALNEQDKFCGSRYLPLLAPKTGVAAGLGSQFDQVLLASWSVWLGHKEGVDFVRNVSEKIVADPTVDVGTKSQYEATLKMLPI